MVIWQTLSRGWVKKTNCCFTTISSQISAIYMNIFHKTEVQTVILRCWMGLFLNWFKSYDIKWKTLKNAKNAKITKNSTYENFFLQKRTKTKMEKIAFCVITFDPIKIQTHSAPQNDRLNFSFVAEIWLEIVVKRQFVSVLFFSSPSISGFNPRTSN